MKTRFLLVLLFVFTLAGCVDTPESISREYRNAINETIDAISLVTSERTADHMSMRILKPFGARFKNIDERLVIVRNNRTKKEFIKDVFESDGIHMYLTELEINTQRLALEKSRLRDLVKQTIDYETDRRQKANLDPLADDREACPILYDLAMKPGELDMLDSQIRDPKMMGYIKSFPEWKVENYPEMLAKFKEKRAKFAPRSGVILVQ